MSIFTLIISYLTTSNLPWFMDLTFQVPMQYCSLQHRTLLQSPVIPTAECCFHFGSASSFLLELFLHSSPVTYWAPTDLGRSSFSVISFCLFLLFMGFLRQECWSGFPFLSPGDHILSEVSTMTHLSWVAQYIISISYWKKLPSCRRTLIVLYFKTRNVAFICYIQQGVIKLFSWLVLRKLV